jgi:hypothetical protein
VRRGQFSGSFLSVQAKGILLLKRFRGAYDMGFLTEIRARLLQRARSRARLQVACSVRHSDWRDGDTEKVYDCRSRRARLGATRCEVLRA